MRSGFFNLAFRVLRFALSQSLNVLRLRFRFAMRRLGWSGRALVLGGSNRRKLLRTLTSRRDLQALSSFSCTDFRFVLLPNLFSLFFFFVFWRLRLWWLFLFRSEFREQFKKEHPNNKSVAVVSDFALFIFSLRVKNLTLFFVYSHPYFSENYFRSAKLVVKNGNRYLMLWELWFWEIF